MFSYWYNDFPQYPRGHIDFWRVRLISHLLLIATLVFLLLAVINFFVLASTQLGILDSIGAFFSLSIYIWFRKTGNINLAAWVATIMVTSITMLFIFILGGQSNSFMWATLMPPIAFFLLGRDWGSFFALIVLAFCCYLAFDLYQTQPTVLFTLGSVLNIVEVSVAHILMFRFYEGIRTEAYEELTLNNTKIQILAETDKLTGLYNREKLDNSLATLISNNIKQNNPLALMIIDIDHFKKINDNEGHLVGDIVLKALAKRLQNKMRTHDILARWGGEEFVIVLPNTSINAAIELAKRLLISVSNEKIKNKGITISIGATEMVNQDNAETILARADKALYNAKKSGRNRVATL